MVPYINLYIFCTCEINSWSGIGEPKKAQVQENSNRPLEHTPDPHPPVYGGNPNLYFYFGLPNGSVPGVRIIKPRCWTHEVGEIRKSLQNADMAYWSPLGQTIPSWELTYPHLRYVWRWVSFSRLVGYVSSLEGKMNFSGRIAPGCDRLVTSQDEDWNTNFRLGKKPNIHPVKLT